VAHVVFRVSLVSRIDRATDGGRDSRVLSITSFCLPLHHWKIVHGHAYTPCKCSMRVRDAAARR
jgi:hypothetical protein